MWEVGQSGLHDVNVLPCSCTQLALLLSLTYWRTLSAVMSTFSGRQTNSLLASVAPPNASGRCHDHELQAFFVALTTPTSSSSETARKALAYLEKSQHLKLQQSIVSTSTDVSKVAAAEDEEKLVASILCRVTIALYAEILEEHLSQASSAEVEADWWGEIERSRINTFYYLVQSTPRYTSRDLG
jgi:nuclear-control-of-ATPase protein 2